MSIYKCATYNGNRQKKKKTNEKENANASCPGL